MALKLITDSATDLPRDYVKAHNLHVIPTPVVIDDVDLRDGVSVFPEDFYKQLRDGHVVTTYHISQMMFYENFKPYAEAGDTVIYFCFSTGIAGTFQAANLAKEDLLEEFPDFDITIIDSKCASMGFGLSVMYLVDLYEKGASKETLIKAADFYFSHMEHIFTVETLEYLYKGGRIKRPAAIAGTLLDIKPLIEVTDDGALTSFEKIRGRNKSLKRLVELVGERAYDPAHQIFGLVHGDCIDDLHRVRDMIAEKYGATEFRESYVGCAIGAHTGPGIVGVTFLDAEPPKFD